VCSADPRGRACRARQHLPAEADLSQRERTYRLIERPPTNKAHLEAGLGMRRAPTVADGGQTDARAPLVHPGIPRGSPAFRRLARSRRSRLAQPRSSSQVYPTLLCNSVVAYPTRHSARRPNRVEAQDTRQSHADSGHRTQHYSTPTSSVEPGLLCAHGLSAARRALPELRRPASREDASQSFVAVDVSCAGYGASCPVACVRPPVGGRPSRSRWATRLPDGTRACAAYCAALARWTQAKPEKSVLTGRAWPAPAARRRRQEHAW
jgi:hypothetical protein